MMVVYIVLGFLVPVVMVFGYSVLLSRRRVASRARNTLSSVEKKCATLKDSAAAGNTTEIEADMDSVLEVVRALPDQNLREQSLGKVMDVYLALGQDENARALLSEVEDEANRANILKEVFGDSG